MLRLGRFDDLSEGEFRVCDAAEGSFIVARVEGSLRVLQNECSHLPERMDGGELIGRCFRCPHHGTQYDVIDGSVINDMGFTYLEPLVHYPCTEEDGVLYLSGTARPAE